jgi:murein DD-endopeptidase MepM/ murein hydrolase activator NlpD
VVDGFDFPVGGGEGTGYYDAQPFGQNHHLGEDWNGTGGGNTDRGDPVTAIADGVVTAVTDGGHGWGAVVRVAHRTAEPDRACVESLYAHLSRVDVVAGDTIGRGASIGAIGDAGGNYPAHLHLELRATPGLPLGGGYGEDALHHLAPTPFIEQRRPHHAR